MFQTERIPNVKFAVLYVRIQETLVPFDGVLKIEKILVRDIQEEEGLHDDNVLPKEIANNLKDKIKEEMQ